MAKPKTRPPYYVGDTVSLTEWDKTVPPGQHLGQCEVIGVREGAISQSGWVIKLRPVLKPSIVIDLDSGWID